MIDTCTVIRLKHGRTGRPEHWGTRTDYICGRMLWYQKPAAVFWHFNGEREARWLEYYRRFSDKKPSHGLCATFCAMDEMKPDELAFIGCDSMLNPDTPFRKWNVDREWPNPHDWKAENDALKGLGIKITDLRYV